MSKDGEVLVAIFKDKLDFNLAFEQHWYRIPVNSAEKWMKNRWPPQWLAFYQTRKVFGGEAFAISYFARVIEIRNAYRFQLFPNEPREGKGTKRYYQLMLEPLKQLPQPIFSRRRRRIVFIPTTWHKFINAVEINDLYNESPLEDRLWAELKRLDIKAERQEFIEINGRHYSLDFAIYCSAGKIDVETDGDTYHTDPEQVPQDDIRYNDLVTEGWKPLRFNTFHINERMEEYCLPKIVENINKLGGVDEGRTVPRYISLDNPGQARQLGLFDQ
jgi:very-short-patch-repair endonuclease